MRFFDLRIVVLGEALSFERQNVGNRVLAIHTEGQTIIAGTARASLRHAVGVVSFPGEKALIDRLEMLKLLIVQTEEKRWNQPIRMAMSTPVLDRENRKRFSQIALQRVAIKERGVVRGRIDSWIVKGRKIVFEPTSNPSAHILKRLINIVNELSLDSGEARSVLPPNPEAVTHMGIGKVLVTSQASRSPSVSR